MAEQKELHEYTLREIQDEAAGNILLAIGRGEFRPILFGALSFAMMVGHARGKRAAITQLDLDYAKQERETRDAASGS